jgi:MFS family permease
MKLEKKTKQIISFRVLLESGMIITSLFLNIFVYKTLGNLSQTLILNFISYLGIFLAFPVFGYFSSKINFKIQKVFYLGSLLASLSFLPFLFGFSIFTLSVFFFVYGLGQGFLWFGINTTELQEVLHHEKEKYIAVLGFWRKGLAIILPLILSAFFFVIGNSSYFIIFITASFLFFSSLFFARNILSYSPEKLGMDDVKHFWLGGRSLLVHTYYFVEGFTHIVIGFLGPLTAYFFLQAESRVGFLNGLASLSFFFFISRSNK